MTSHPDPIPTNEQLQDDVADLRERIDKTDMLMAVMVQEIKRLRQRASGSSR